MVKGLLLILLFYMNAALAQADPYSIYYPTYPKARSIDTVFLKPFQAKKVICYKKKHLEIVFDAEGFEEQIASMVAAYRQLPHFIIRDENHRKLYQVGVDSSIAILQEMQHQLRRQSARDTVQITHDPLPGFLTLSGDIDQFIMAKIRLGKCHIQSEANKETVFIIWSYEEFMPGTSGNRYYLPNGKTYFLQYISSQQ
jgi:hypothetical protein